MLKKYPSNYETLKVLGTLYLNSKKHERLQLAKVHIRIVFIRLLAPDRTGSLLLYSIQNGSERPLCLFVRGGRGMFTSISLVSTAYFIYGR